jgi:hypothetical protein
MRQVREAGFARTLMAKVLERSLYKTDYYAWTKDQAAKLRADLVAVRPPREA